MAKFKCAAPDCGATSERRRAPASCLTPHRCEWTTCDSEVHSGPPALELRVGGQVFRAERTFVLGRNGDIAIEQCRHDLSISREHCRVEPKDGQWEITALSKSSPLSIDGQLLSSGSSRALPLPSCRLVLGETFSVFIATAEDAGAPAESDAEPRGALDELLRARDRVPR